MLTTIIVVLSAYCVALAAVPAFSRLAYRLGAVDKPGLFKVHQREVPLSGGVGVLIATVVAILIWRLLTHQAISDSFLGLLVGSFAFCGLGLLDDIHKLSVRVRFWLMTMAAFVVILFLKAPTTSFYLLWLWMVVGTFFLVGLSNAVNMLDGLDGLAAGSTGISLCGLSFLLFSVSETAAAVGALLLAAAWLAFLRYNRPPARVFMGSAGALFAGFALAYLGLSVISAARGAFWSFVSVAFVLWVPLFDALGVMLSRFLRGVSIFQKDNYHIHHRLMASGFSRRQTVVFVQILSAVGAVSGVAFVPNSIFSARLCVPALFLAIVAVVLLHYRAAKGAKQFLLMRREVLTLNGASLLVSQFRVEERSGAVHIETYLEKVNGNGGSKTLYRLVSSESGADDVWQHMLSRAHSLLTS
ncbi:MAG: hypothetical protein DRP82_01300 [Planctomycetota bacterium]|nr:MAG: hypothetical protein DRP82_01300 [Planctomycetota bacterium]